MLSALINNVSSLIGRGGKPAHAHDQTKLEQKQNDQVTTVDEVLELDGGPEPQIILGNKLKPSVDPTSSSTSILSSSRYLDVNSLRAALKAANIVWEDDDSNSRKTFSNGRGASSYDDENYDEEENEDEESDEEELENDEGEDPVELESKKDIGKITKMEDGFSYGLIDGMYRFHKADFIGKGPFHCYDMVEFVAVQKYDPKVMSVEWTVTEMKPYLKPVLKEIQMNSVNKTRTLQVKEITDHVVKCSDNEVAEGIPAHMMPLPNVLVGDWLQVSTKDVKAQGSDQCFGNYVSVEFVRKYTRRGRITKWNPNYAVVDENIVIMSRDHCDGKKFPQHGDRVKVEYIDSDQKVLGGFSHRAISVRPGRADGDQSHQTLEDREFPIRALDGLLSDKNGIVVTPAQKRIKFQPSRVGAKLTHVITIQNTSNKTHYLRKVRVGNDQSVCNFSVKFANKESASFIKMLEPDASFNLTISCEPLLIGWTSDFVIMEFNGFEIGRELRVKSLPADMETLTEISKDKVSLRVYRKARAAEAASVKQKLLPFQSIERKQVQGVEVVRRPFFLPKMEEKTSSFKIPEFVIQACEHNSANILYEHCPTLRPAPGNETSFLNLTFHNYKEMFHVALWFEELHHLKKKQKFSLADVVLERCGEYFAIPFPEAKEVLPSFNWGDPLSICDRQNPTGEIISTFIQEVRDNKLCIKMGEAFSQSYAGTPLNVEFKIGRTSYRRRHFAVENSVTSFGENWLFPCEPLLIQEPRIIFFDDKPEAATNASVAPVIEPLYRLHTPVQQPLQKRGSFDRRKRSVRLPQIDEAPEDNMTKEVTLRWYNESLNEEQRNAVKRILKGDARPVPYIIFGPPGTGKSVTVVEAVTQINRIEPNSRILVTAPSNAAADLLCTYLIEIGKYRIGEFVRLLGFNRADSNSTSEIIKPYCQDGDNIEAICKARIIVSTCNGAGQFFQMDPKLSALHITHVFIDEAGYCSEPDSLIPCLFVSHNTQAQVILAGDPKQLGPIVFDDSAAAYSLEGSLLERLMKNPIYKRDPVTKKYNELLVTKLVRNYRAHPELLQFPSKCFYDNELIASALDEVMELCNLPFLPKKGVPLIFDGVRGEQAKAPDSPSWYNALEVIRVTDYVRQLLDLNLNGVTVDDIGIITPYRKQVDKIRLAISMGLKCRLPKVGSVEEFQGGEKKIIILSLVRSTEVDEESELVAKLQFVLSERRLNVSATRARALFIVIGNPKVFAIDPTWKIFLKHCIKKGVYIGCDLPVFLRDYYKKYNRKEEEAANDFDPDAYLYNDDRGSEDSDDDC